MNRRTVLAQLAVFAVISIVVVGYAMFNLLGVNLTSPPFTVTVQLKTAGGIFQGAEVAYRGVAVGRVSSVQLQTSGVVLRLAIGHGRQIPDSAIAHVYDLSAVGEQYVDLVPSGPSPRYLHSGSVIPADRTTTPLQTATVLYDLERFVDSINPGDIQVIGREGAAAFAGVGPALKSLLSDSATLVDQLSHSQGAALDLLKNSAPLLADAAAHRADFDTFATSLDALTTTLRSSTPAIDAFIRGAEPDTELIDALVRSNESAIGVLLANLATLSDIQVARLPGLASLLVAVPEFGVKAPTVVHAGSLLGAANFNYDQPVCPTGVPLSSPLSGKRTPVAAVTCPQDILTRGAANAPAANSQAAVQPSSANAAQPSSANAAQPSSANAAQPSSANAAQLSGYDVSSGLTATADGSLVRLGTNGGQEELLGANSWQAMVLAVTGG